MKIDLHNHLRTRSNFEEKDFNRLVNVASRKLGKRGAIGLVNMVGENAKNYERVIGFRGYDRIDLENAVYVPEKDVLIIKSQEIPTNQGHFLAVGLKKNKHIGPWRDLEDTIKDARDENCLIFADHPFYFFGGSGFYLEKNPNILDQIDGLEIHNGEAVLQIPGQSNINSNQKAREFYLNVKKDYPHIIPLSTSDGHSFREIGSSYVEIRDLNLTNDETLIDSLRENLKHPISYKMHNSYLGAIQHGVYLGIIIKLMKWGLYSQIKEQDKKLP